MGSRAASFGKRAVAAPRPRTRVPAPRGEQPDSRPASVIAALNESPSPRPLAVVAPSRAFRLSLWGAAVAGITLSFCLLPPGRHGNAATDAGMIRPADMPRDEQAMKDRSFALVEKYPRDPRSHLYRGLYFLDRKDASDAEPYLRSALRLDAARPVLSGQMHDWALALLALDITMMGRSEEARAIAAPLCKRDDLDIDSRVALHSTKLCL